MRHLWATQKVLVGRMLPAGTSLPTSELKQCSKVLPSLTNTLTHLHTLPQYIHITILLYRLNYQMLLYTTDHNAFPHIVVAFEWQNPSSSTNRRISPVNFMLLGHSVIYLQLSGVKYHKIKWFSQELNASLVRELKPQC